MKKVLMLLAVTMLLFCVRGQAAAYFEDGHLIRAVYQMGGQYEALTDLGPFTPTAPYSGASLSLTSNPFPLAGSATFPGTWDRLYVSYFIKTATKAWTSGPVDGQKIGSNHFDIFQSAVDTVHQGAINFAAGTANAQIRQTDLQSYVTIMDLGDPANAGGYFAGFNPALNGEQDLTAIGTGSPYVDSYLYYYATPDYKSAGVQVANIRTYADGHTEIDPVDNTAVATHFAVSAPVSAIAGTPFNFTVTAMDAGNNVVAGYAGTVHFTSDDPKATLPADTTLTNGTGTFPATLKTSGSRTITATDTVIPSLKGISNSITTIKQSYTYVSTIPSGQLYYFNGPNGVAVDGSGNVYVADSGNNRIQKYDSNGVYMNTLGETDVYGTDNSHFNDPNGVAVDGSGNVYVADSGNNRIQKYNSDGVYVSTLGETGVWGTDNSHFWYPNGVAVDGSGNVYVADPNNDRIQKYDSNGVYVSTIGESGVYGADNSHFWYPNGVAVDGSGNVYVADSGNNRIQKFNASGMYVSTIGESGVYGADNSHFWYPNGVAVDGSGNVYVTDTYNHRFQKFNASGMYVSTLGVSGVAGTDNNHFYYPNGVTVDGLGNVYVADSGNERIQKFNSSDAYVSTLGSFGADNNHFYYPNGVAVDGSGNVYVADTFNYRIQKFNSSGTYVHTIGVADVPGADNNHFSLPTAVAVDGSGNVYVADEGNNRIQKFNSSGVYVSTLGETCVQGTDNNHFYYPNGVAVDGLGNVYVADTFNYRIQKYDSSGAYVSTLDGEAIFNTPWGVAVDGLGNVYVAHTNSQRIQKFNSSGAYVSTLGVAGVTGTDNSLFFQPTGVAVDGTGNVYVVDSGNQRIQKYNSNGVYVSTIGVAGVKGTDNSYFNYPTGVAVDGTGNVYVVDSGNQRIQKFGYIGRNALTITGMAGNATGVVTGGSSISCSFAANGTASGSCSESDDPGIAIVLTASPAAGSCVSWTGCTSSSGNTCNVTLNSDITVTASFTLNQYSLSVNTVGSGSGIVGGGGTYDYGTTHSITASASIGSTFTGWSGDCTGTTSPLSVLVDKAKTCTANFTILPVGVPVFTLSSSALSFASIKAGTASPAKTITISNTGTGTLNVGSINVTGNDASAFTWSGSCAPMVKNATCTLSVTFNASAPYVQKKASLSISSNDPKKPTATVTLSGATAAPIIYVSPSAPSAVNFGTVAVGLISSTKTVTIRNTGMSDLTISDVSIVGSNSSEFSQINNCALIPANGSCQISMTFGPLNIFGLKNAILNIISNDPKRPAVSVNLSGSGAPPVITVSSPAINFGTVAIGVTSPTKTVTIKNTGLFDLAIPGISIAGTNAAEFSQTNNCVSIPARGSCPVNITMSPGTVGSKVAHLNVLSNDPKKPSLAVNLTGMGK